MADFNNAVMTNAGAALLADTIIGTAKIRFTKLVTGSGNYADSERERIYLQSFTSLKDPKQEIPFSTITMASTTCVKLVALISNTELKTGYYVNEIGIYAINELDENSVPVLYSIAVANMADYLPPYNGLTPSTITQEYYTTVDNALEVTIQTNTGAVALVEDVEKIRQQLNDLKLDIENTGLIGDETNSENQTGIIFDEAETRENISSGDSILKIFGKIKKWFSDLKAAAWCSVSNNCTTTEEGHVLDARQGKILQEGMEEIRIEVTEVNSIVDQLKKSVADGKALVASAITGKGVSTAADASFVTIAANIKNISTTPIVNSYSSSPGDASFNRTLFTADRNGTVSTYAYGHPGDGSASCRVRINGAIQSNGVRAISAGSVVSVEGTNNGSYTRTMYSVVYVRV